MDAGLLLVRTVFGLVMAAHGAQKVFGWFGGYGLTGTGGFFEQLGFRPGKAFAAAAGLAELTGGLLFALGLLTPFAAALIVSVMVVAALAVHWQNGLFAQNNGIEVPLLYAVAAIAVALMGPGIYSADAQLGLTAAWTPAITLGALAAGAVGGLLNLAIRRPAAQTANA